VIRIKIRIKCLNGATYSDTKEVENDYIISRRNPEFIKIIEQTISDSHLEEIDTVKVTVYFGEI